MDRETREARIDLRGGLALSAGATAQYRLSWNGAVLDAGPIPGTLDTLPQARPWDLSVRVPRSAIHQHSLNRLGIELRLGQGEDPPADMLELSTVDVSWHPNPDPVPPAEPESR